MMKVLEKEIEQLTLSKETQYKKNFNMSSKINELETEVFESQSIQIDLQDKLDK